ncbi:MAG: hypothetical protein JXQ27_18030 [Acidobacteria bacterium]|nr:hypothetical protein [Acidobacteriota bacterium]
MSQKSTRNLPPVALLGMAWLVPGSAHLFLNRRFRAVLYFVTVGLFFWLSIALGAYVVIPGTEGYATESFAMFKFLGGLANGLHFFLALIFKSEILNYSTINQLKAVLTNEYATTLLYTAGIINILSGVDALDIWKGKKN